MQSRPGSILAIMGPSGAGKTSLLDILSGNRSKGVTGNMYVDGNQISAGSWAMKKITGYVHQVTWFLTGLNILGSETFSHANCLGWKKHMHAFDDE